MYYLIRYVIAYSQSTLFILNLAHVSLPRQDALLALGFFVLMVVIVFSTLLHVRSLFSLCWPDSL
jgi:hypothetical protein